MEVLVVSLIVAILAAVAIPVYSGYITNQRNEVAKNIAQSTAAAANIYTRRNGAAPNCAHPACVSLLNIFLSDPAQYKININGSTKMVTVIDSVHNLSQTAAF